MGKWKPKIKQTELIEKCLEQIEYETGFHISEKHFGDGYWLQSGVENSVCNFNIKEIPKFTFGIWIVDNCAGTKKERAECLMDDDKEPIWTDYVGIRADSDLVFFTQYTRDIDKFKPSRSGFVIGIKRNTWIGKVDDETLKQDGIFYMDDVIDCLNYMKKHPIKSYYYTGIMSNNIWDQRSNYRILKVFLTDFYYYSKNKIQKSIKKRRLTSKSKKLCKSLTQFNYFIEDRVDWYPSIHIDLRRKDDVDIDIYSREWDRIQKFDRKYGHLLSLYWSEYCLTVLDKLSDEDIQKDRDLRESFDKIITKKIRDFKENKSEEGYILIDYSYDKEVV